MGNTTVNLPNCELCASKSLVLFTRQHYFMVNRKKKPAPKMGASFGKNKIIYLIKSICLQLTNESVVNL